MYMYMYNSFAKRNQELREKVKFTWKDIAGIAVYQKKILYLFFVRYFDD